MNCAITALLALVASSIHADPATTARAARPPAAAVVSRSTPHLAFSATISPSVIVPGKRMSIVVDVVPKPGMHVYAPGTKYRALALALQPNPLLRVHDAVYPEPTRYLFEPLKEQVLVYSARFRLMVDVTAGEDEEARAQLAKRRRLTVTGRLEYQACDDRVCYLPASVPVQWIVRIKTR